MKGIIFNVLEEVVLEQFDDATWDSMLDSTGTDGAYTSLGSYPDEELYALVGAASEAMNLPPSEVLKWFGRRAMPVLAARYPAFFEGSSSTRSFLLSVNSIIHPEVRKLYSGAGCPHFRFDENSAGDLLLGYNSPRKLCALAEGFIEGAAEHYREKVQVAHRSCMRSGDGECLLAVQWLS